MQLVLFDVKAIQSAMPLKLLCAGKRGAKGLPSRLLIEAKASIDRELAMMDEGSLTILSGKTQTGFIRLNIELCCSLITKGASGGVKLAVHNTPSYNKIHPFHHLNSCHPPFLAE